MSHINGTNVNGPPVAQTSDYIGIGVLAAMLCIGGPLNILSLLRSLGIDVKNVFLRCCRRTNSTSTQQRRTRRAALTLNFHLTVANLLVIWVYVLSEIFWRMTYEWLGGDALCRLVRFVHAFCFYATSNLVSTIALDRLYIAVRIDRPGGAAARSNAVRWFSNCAWTLALICSLPQLFVWRTFEAFPGWQQCVTVWTVVRYLQENTTVTVGSNIWSSSEEEASARRLEQRVEEADYHERLYNGLHLAFVFWLPVFLIIVCYALIVTRFHRDIRKKNRDILEAASVGENEALSNSTPTPLSRSPRQKRCQKGPQRFRETHELTVDSTTYANESASLVRISSVHRPVSKSTFKCCWGKGSQNNRLQRHVTTTKVSTDQSTVNNDLLAPPINLLNAAIISAGQPLLPRNFAASTLMRAKRRTVKKSVWILLAYFICWSPYNVLSLWRYFSPTFEHSFLEILNDLIVLNAVVNPLIYGI